MMRRKASHRAWGEEMRGKRREGRSFSTYKNFAWKYNLICYEVLA